MTLERESVEERLCSLLWTNDDMKNRWG